VLVQCRHEAFRFRCSDVTDREDGTDVPKPLTPGQRLQADVRLREGFTLELRVEDEEHLPVEGAKVHFLADDGLTVSHRSFRDRLTGREGLAPAPATDAQGRVRIEGLSATVPDGYQYVLVVDHTQYVTHILPGIDKLPRDGNVAQLTVGLERGQRVAGCVIAGDTGRPIEGAEVRTVYHPYGIISNGRPWPCCERAATDPHGHFDVGLPQEITAPLTVNHSAWQSATVILGDRSLAQPITVQMVPGHVVTGQVLGRDGRPVADADVEAVATGSSLWSILNTARADGQGMFKLGGLPTDRRVWLVARDSADNYVCFGIMEVHAGEDHVVLDGRDVVEVDGRVVDEAGRPVSVRVSCLVHAPLDESGCILSKADPLDRLGHFRAALPRNGTVLLALAAHDDLFASPFFNVAAVTTRDGHVDRPLTITGQPPCEQALKLVDAATGQPIAEAEVTLSPIHLWFGMWVGYTNEAGRLVIDHLPPGKAEVFVVARGYEPLIEHPVTVPTDGEIVIRLEPKAKGGAT
jgi:protocatechuate 3,4-dioxygenase beta subunit